MRAVNPFAYKKQTDDKKQIPQENTNNRWSCFRKIKPRTVNGLFEFPVEVEFFSVEEDEDSMEDEDSITLEILSEGGLVSLSSMRYGSIISSNLIFLC